MKWMYTMIRSFETWNESSITELCIGDENHTWKSSLCHFPDIVGHFVTQVKLFNAFLPVRQITCRWSSSYIDKLIKVVTLLKIIFYMVRKVRTLQIHPITPIKKVHFHFFHFIFFISFFHFFIASWNMFHMLHKHDKNMIPYTLNNETLILGKKVKLYGKSNFIT